MEAEWRTDVELQNAHARCLRKNLFAMRRSVSIHLHEHRCGYHNISLRLPFVRVPVVPDLSASGLVPLGTPPRTPFAVVRMDYNPFSILSVLHLST
jgi:hypothetical protein